MPRWASRIMLEITGVKIERLQDISDEDLLAEGIDFEYVGRDQAQQRRAQFMALWDKLNGTKYPWVDNVWVWAIAFKRVTE